MHSELSEALEALRDNKLELYFILKGRFQNNSTMELLENKPEGMVVELVDCIIRIFDLCGALSLNLYRALEEKIYYNNNYREYKHSRGNF